ncbi:excinuclease ABC subunit UvrA [Fusibacter paucivorans]|uniref:UvrABC system protein A n=1 Tax=Fusibacter paucivorans TaxID=76009 RepID=A0ABS5PP77_9FIRM|nr:excinuclease ABC subunit UvrA [Fusibacter paucivorans]MBS7526980.1 excinuclease ABC subunit UvrA [Fusibacter paucivorans]
MSKNEIFVKCAKEHNLKGIDVHIPRDQMVVITGLSGSGKSSLAFDTIYAEGQRRYVESLSAYARQFLGQMEKPNVEYIEGLSPAISIDQKTTSRNPRSTVGTVTEIYDYLRLLYARVGIPHCPVCGIEISPQTVDQIVDKILALDEGTRIQVLAPVVVGKKGQHQKLLAQLKKEGYVRARIDTETFDLADTIELDKNKKHTIEVVIDRLVVKPEIQQRLTDALESVLKLTEGLIIIDVIGGEDLSFNTQFSCPEHGEGITEMEPRMFSFNAPYGACPTCNGLGFTKKVDPELLVPDTKLSIEEGALLPIANSSEGSFYVSMINAMLESYGVTQQTPFRAFPEKLKNEIFYGTGDRVVTFEYDSKYAGYTSFSRPFEGLVNNFERRYAATNSEYIREKIDEFMSLIECETCHGKRLKDEVLAVTVGDMRISDITEMSVKDALIFFDQLTLSATERKIAEQILKEIVARLTFLQNVGLEYLNLSRAASTLSGGESQRIRLATQIGSGLVGVLYILDEPSIGLHQKDNQKLLKTLRSLTNLGNTLIVVEHDEETITAADYILDLGPGAGEHGGYIIAEGPYETILNSEDSITGQYLSGRKHIDLPKVRRLPRPEHITITKAVENNLKSIDVDFPLGVLCVVTGVSGSGKSTLVNEILYKSCALKINKSRVKPGKHEDILGLEHIDKIIDIDQSPIGRTPRSNPATYTGVFDHIRDIFAQVPESKMRGYQKGRFSFNVAGGRCEHCKGDGIIKIEMHFLPDVYVQCDVCKGKRYNRETLEVKYKGKTISDVLDLTVEEALEFFANIPKIKRKIKTLHDVGLDYIRLGQPSTQLSGGEAQRIKLATELSKVSTGKTLYILDEPTTGLHTADVHNLIHVLQKLVDAGNTVIVIEHNLDVVKSADYIIDLGPDGGDKGGCIVARGTPEEVARIEGSYTGAFLADMLAKEPFVPEVAAPVIKRAGRATTKTDTTASKKSSQKATAKTKASAKRKPAAKEKSSVKATTKTKTTAKPKSETAAKTTAKTTEKATEKATAKTKATATVKSSQKASN